MKISKFQHSQIYHSQGWVTLLEFLNPALPHCHTYTGNKAHWWKYQKSGIHKPTMHSGKSLYQNYQIRHCQIWQLHWWQNTLVKISKIQHSQIHQSHCARIPKSGNGKFQQLHWQQNNLLKIPKIQHSQIQHMQGQVTLPELPNPALPNCQTYTGGRTHRGKTHCQNY